MFHPGSFSFIGPLWSFGCVARAKRALTIHTYLIGNVVAQNQVARTKKVEKSLASAVGRVGAEMKVKFVNAGGFEF
jgi:hypothetical protein